MGCSCAKSNEQSVGNPMSQQDQIVNHEFAPILSINHPFNINKKYEAVAEIIREQYTGLDIKKTHAYKTSLTKQEIDKKRQEFWETRTEGRTECWLALKQACQMEEHEALAIIVASGLKLVNRSMQITFDQEGHKYDVPVFCINEPVAYAVVSKLDQYLIQEFESKPVELRVVGIEKNFNIAAQTSQTITELKVLCQATIQIQYRRFRLFLAGREMLNHHKVGNYLLDKDTIVQAFVSNVE